jgi:hypothetical protein
MVMSKMQAFVGTATFLIIVVSALAQETPPLRWRTHPDAIKKREQKQRVGEFNHVLSSGTWYGFYRYVSAVQFVTRAT